MYFLLDLLYKSYELEKNKNNFSVNLFIKNTNNSNSIKTIYNILICIDTLIELIKKKKSDKSYEEILNMINSKYNIFLNSLIDNIMLRYSDYYNEVLNINRLHCVINKNISVNSNNYNNILNLLIARIELVKKCSLNNEMFCKIYKEQTINLFAKLIDYIVCNNILDNQINILKSNIENQLNSYNEKSLSFDISLSIINIINNNIYNNI